MFKKLALALVVLATSGCMSQGEIKPIDTKNSQIIKKDIYAKLEKTNSGYQFTSFRFTEEPGEGPWVSLYTGEPTWDTSTEKCLKGLARDELKCNTANANLFRFDSTMSAEQAASWGVMSALTLGLWATMPPGQVVFDRKLYEKAYDSAYEKIHPNIGTNIRNLIVEANLNAVVIEKEVDKIHYEMIFSNRTGQVDPHINRESIGLGLLTKNTSGSIIEVLDYLEKVSTAATTKKQYDAIFDVVCKSATVGGYELDIRCGELNYDSSNDKLVAPVYVNVMAYNGVVKKTSLHPKMPYKFNIKQSFDRQRSVNTISGLKENLDVNNRCVALLSIAKQTNTDESIDVNLGSIAIMSTIIHLKISRNDPKFFKHWKEGEVLKYYNENLFPDALKHKKVYEDFWSSKNGNVDVQKYFLGELRTCVEIGRGYTDTIKNM
jgi:hypothetical protein